MSTMTLAHPERRSAQTSPGAASGIVKGHQGRNTVHREDRDHPK